MKQYKIEESIRDVIRILDLAPIQVDMIGEKNLAQLTNRVPIAHLAIERGLKALISQGGGSTECTHSLHKLYLDLGKCDHESADYLSVAFNDAVKFFGYNTNAKGVNQFRTLNDYFSKVGGKKAFDELRYWAIGQSSNSDSPIPYISLRIHRELLCALEDIFLSGFCTTVSGRVEHEVDEAITLPTRLYYGVGDIQRESSIKWYINWLGKHDTRRSALEESVRKNFVVRVDDDIVGQILRDSYDELKASEDPAVRYYLYTLTYLPIGSQRRNPDAVPIVEWLAQDETRCRVLTPADRSLGYVDRQADGAWAISPLESGPFGVSAVAWALADAKCYLVNRLTRQVTVAIRGEDKQLRIVSEKDFFPSTVGTAEFQDAADWDSNGSIHGLEFWDAEHGLCPEDTVGVNIQMQKHPGTVAVLEGTVAKVENQKVWIRGRVVYDLIQER